MQTGAGRKFQLIDAFTDMLWNSLNEDNKVSLFVRYINVETKQSTDRIVNKNQ